jgi:hypothetical protein
VSDRHCRRGHPLILGETAYEASVWVWCRVGCRRLKGDAAHAADTTGNVRWNPHVGRDARWAKGPGAWEHRRAELRCRVCNRDRVAQFRKAKRVIGVGVAPNYAPRGPVIGGYTSTNYTEVRA